MSFKAVGKALLLFSILLCFNCSVFAQSWVKHDMEVVLQPKAGRIEVKDQIQIKDLKRSMITVSLNRRLSLSSKDKNIVSIKPITQSISKPGALSTLTQYSIQFKKIPQQFQLEYNGKLTEPGADASAQNAGIAAENIFLDGQLAWYPAFYQDELLSFTLRLQLPDKWYGVSQGERVQRLSQDGKIREIWRESLPQPDIYLIAAPFFEYQKQQPGLSYSVYLRSEDEPLADKYLTATTRYINFYNNLIAPYPYPKFATVENTWNSGLGMPSFTLLGSRILRFPFILTSSFPHEILHNWWGNSVYVDYSQGNWSEGLTDYLADHLLKEQVGEATQFRLNSLQDYHDYVGSNGDFSIANFQSRSDRRTQAVGYAKTAMMFHMLRLYLGDAQFIDALRYFYRQHKFSFASFKDLEHSFSANSEIDLSAFFSQWVDRIGAPVLKVEQIDARKTGANYLMTMALQQTQSGAPYQLLVPLWIWFDNEKPPLSEMLNLNQKQQIFRFNYKNAPIRVDIDPQYDVFRRLDDGEIPAALSQGFGSDKVYLILPKRADKTVYEAYQRLATQWKGIIAQLEIHDDNQLARLPDNANIWVLGWDNHFRNQVSNCETGMPLNTWPDKLMLGDRQYRKGERAVVLAGRRTDNKAYSLLWLAADKVDTINALARKLPHYGSYSYLVFDEDKVSNLDKGKWLLEHTPMKFYLTAAKGHYAPIPQRPPLAVIAP